MRRSFGGWELQFCSQGKEVTVLLLREDGACSFRCAGCCEYVLDDGYIYVSSRRSWGHVDDGMFFNIF